MEGTHGHVESVADRLVNPLVVLKLVGGQGFVEIEGLGDGSSDSVTVTATAEDGSVKTFQAKVRIDTPKEAEYYRNGGILHYVLRQLAAG